MAKKTETTVAVEASQIVVQGTDFDKAIEVLTQRKKDAERVISFHEQFEDADPLDALVAFSRALAKIYGWVGWKSTPGFFGPTPPQMIPVRVGQNETIHVPYGLVQLPGLRGHMNTILSFDPPKPMFCLQGQVRQKDFAQFKRIAETTRELLKTDSIYRGKAFKVNWNWQREDRQFNPAIDAPKFLNLSGVKGSDLVYSEKVRQQLEIGLWTPVTHTESCRLHQIPLHRGILLAGEPGVGKTLTALYTAKLAMDNGWTFVYLESILDLSQGIQLAKLYSPAMIFAEDVDRVVGTQQRTIEIDHLLNAIDGLEGKGTELVTVFTTNNVSSINEAFRRQGRIDKVIWMTPPDAAAAIKLVKNYSNGLISEDADYEKIGEVLSGRIPAAIREVVESAKLSTVARLNGGTIAGSVTEDDILYAAEELDDRAKLFPVEIKPQRETVTVHVHVPNSLKTSRVQFSKYDDKIFTEKLEQAAQN